MAEFTLVITNAECAVKHGTSAETARANLRRLPDIHRARASDARKRAKFGRSCNDKLILFS